MKKQIFAACILMTLSAGAQEKNQQQLFNGKNLNGWYSFLSSKGKNNDPEKVFTIDKGLLHISGKEFGYICTEDVFKNFHLTVEFKWGTKKYPPRDADTIKRDNGICFYMPLSVKDTVWPKSIECQVQEGDVGDMWLIDSATVVVDGKKTEPKDFLMVKKKKDNEKPNGEWNLVEVIVNKGKISYLVNGVFVNEAKSPSLNEGKILIQSEGAEIFYRKIDIAVLE